MMASSFSPTHYDKFCEIACFAYEHSPFYRYFYDSHNINPYNVSLPEELPLVSQIDLIQNGLKFRTDLPVFRVTASSGTTGNPKIMFRTEEDFNHSVNNQIQLMKWCGVESSDIVGICHYFGLWGYRELTQESTRKLGGIAVPIGMLSNTITLQLLKKFGVTVLDITPSHLYKLLVLSQNQPFPERPPIRCIMVAGEPITPRVRQLAWEIWGATVFEQYGSEETDGLGGENEPGKGFNLFHDDYLFELFDLEHLDEKKQYKRLVITSFYHKGTPLIRYQIDDIFLVDRESDRIRVVGRVGEYLNLFDGVLLYPFHITKALDSLNIHYDDWQCVLDNLGNGIERMTLYLLCSEEEHHFHKDKILEALENCNIDLSSLISEGNLIIEVNTNALFNKGSQRRKTPRLIDNRFVKPI